MTMPNAPLSSWRNSRITAWWKRGSWIAVEAISSSPATGSTARSAAVADLAGIARNTPANSASPRFAPSPGAQAIGAEADGEGEPAEAQGGNPADRAGALGVADAIIEIEPVRLVRPHHPVLQIPRTQHVTVGSCDLERHQRVMDHDAAQGGF